MQSPASGLKFCEAQAQVACAILAHTATRMTFYVFLNLPLPNNREQTFSRAKGSSLSSDHMTEIFLLTLKMRIV